MKALTKSAVMMTAFHSCDNGVSHHVNSATSTAACRPQSSNAQSPLSVSGLFHTLVESSWLGPARHIIGRQAIAVGAIRTAYEWCRSSPLHFPERDAR